MIENIVDLYALYRPNGNMIRKIISAPLFNGNYGAKISNMPNSAKSEKHNKKVCADMEIHKNTQKYTIKGLTTHSENEINSNSE